MHRAFSSVPLMKAREQLLESWVPLAPSEVERVLGGLNRAAQKQYTACKPQASIASPQSVRVPAAMLHNEYICSVNNIVQLVVKTERRLIIGMGKRLIPQQRENRDGSAECGSLWSFKCHLLGLDTVFLWCEGLLRLQGGNGSLRRRAWGSNKCSEPGGFWESRVPLESTCKVIFLFSLGKFV